ncbi:MAG: LuxR C-terminal-related transcriptional regulator [Sphingomonas sp.]
MTAFTQGAEWKTLIGYLQALILIRTSLAAVQQANETNDYEVLFRLGAKGFQSASPPAQLFAPLRAYNLNAAAGAPDVILDLIEAILSGNYDVDSGGAASPAPGLSPRQFEVLMLLAEGCPNKIIRYRLGIAERTVRAHLTELFHSLGVTSRVQALVRARAMKLIE